MENQIIFNKWKADIESVNILNKIDCLRIVELNVSNVCNLKCPFCPHSQNFNAIEQFMSMNTVNAVANQLKTIKYDGYICIAGHGEPTLHPKILEILEALFPVKTVLVTNGTMFDNTTWKRISELCQIKVSVHDWKNIEQYRHRFEKTNAIFRNHDIENPQMNVYNRAGSAGNTAKIVAPCNYPFYKIMIDVDGAYEICEADWVGKTKTNFTCEDINIKDYFCAQLDSYRKAMLTTGNRQNISCCSACDINGCLIGTVFREAMRSTSGWLS